MKILWDWIYNHTRKESQQNTKGNESKKKILVHTATIGTAQPVPDKFPKIRIAEVGLKLSENSVRAGLHRDTSPTYL
jgi:hypothetical protein